MPLCLEGFCELMKKYLIFLLAWISLGLGVVGMVFPVLPTTPFLLLSAWAFGKTSEKFRNWLRGTWVYRTYAIGFEDGKGITLAKKFHILLLTWGVMAITILIIDFFPAKVIIVVIGLIFGSFLFFKLPTRSQEDEVIKGEDTIAKESNNKKKRDA